MLRRLIQILSLLVCVAFTSSFSQELQFDDDSTETPSDTPRLISNLNITAPLVIETDEDKSMRWLIVSGGASESNGVISKPILEADGNAGSFTFRIDGVDTTSYLGSQMQRDHGQYPIQYQVEFVDSQSIYISGRTLPYDEINSYYAFDSDVYHLEFIFAEKVPVAELIKDTESQPKAAKTTATSQEPQIKKPLKKLNWSSSAMMPRLFDAIKIAGAVLVLILLVLVIVFLLKKIRVTKPSQTGNFAEMLDGKTAEGLAESTQKADEPEVLSPEQKEEKIRTLMETEGISYDEAALRIQYTSMQ